MAKLPKSKPDTFFSVSKDLIAKIWQKSDHWVACVELKDKKQLILAIKGNWKDCSPQLKDRVKQAFITANELKYGRA